MLIAMAATIFARFVATIFAAAVLVLLVVLVFLIVLIFHSLFTPFSLKMKSNSSGRAEIIAERPQKAGANQRSLVPLCKGDKFSTLRLLRAYSRIRYKSKG